MVLDIVRDSTVGQVVNWASSGKYFPYADQRPGYQLPSRSADISRTSTRVPSAAPSVKDESELEKGQEKTSAPFEQAPVPSSDIPDNAFLVDWDGPNDPDNPRNWSTLKRNFVLLDISLLTFSVYIGSAIYTASIPGLMQQFGVNQVVGTLGLSLYVFAYGIGPMVLSPLQELPSIGRNPVYIATLFLFVIFQIPTALAKNMATVLVFRFLAGFVASPALATGGASLSDVFPQAKLPYVIGVWSMGAVMGPVLGPVIGGFAAQAKSWRWPIWELLWISVFSLIFLSLFLPETLGDTILLKRARRIRKLTGDDRYMSLSEIKQANLTAHAIAVEYLLRPFQLMLEPAVLFVNIYIALAYAVFYLWFEAFPLVFIDIYHFNLGVSGLPFLGLIVSTGISFAAYASYHYFYTERRAARGIHAPLENGLYLALVAGAFIPISLFVFGWTSRASVHWMVPVVGSALYMPGIYILFQTALVYLPSSYPQYAASILAGNDFFRSSVASAFPLFGKAFFVSLGLGGGSSLLAGVAILMMPALYALIIYGARLRAMSKYATTA